MPGEKNSSSKECRMHARTWRQQNGPSQTGPHSRLLSPLAVQMAVADWPAFAAALAAGRADGCRNDSVAVPSSRHSRYCHWGRVQLVNISRVCPTNRKCGRVGMRWRPPGLREHSKADAQRCLADRWVLFVGDSHARTMAHVLMHHLGASVWPQLPTSVDLWAASTEWPTGADVTGGQCSGSTTATHDRLRWNMSATRSMVGAAESGATASASEAAASEEAAASTSCTRDYRVGRTRVSFIFLSRLRSQWGQLCDLVSTEYAQWGGAPDAIVMSHSAWPMIYGERSRAQTRPPDLSSAPPHWTSTSVLPRDAPHASLHAAAHETAREAALKTAREAAQGGDIDVGRDPCDAPAYARDLYLLMQLLLLRQAPPEGVTLAATCATLPPGSPAGPALNEARANATAAPSVTAAHLATSPAPMREVVPPSERTRRRLTGDGPNNGEGTHRRASRPLLFWLTQTKMQAPIAKRCLLHGRWIEAQERALRAFDSRLRAGATLPRAAVAGSPQHQSLTAVDIVRLDGWHLVDAAESCLLASECAAAPSPVRMVHTLGRREWRASPPPLILYWTLVETQCASSSTHTHLSCALLSPLLTLWGICARARPRGCASADCPTAASHCLTCGRLIAVDCDSECGITSTTIYPFTRQFCRISSTMLALLSFRADDAHVQLYAARSDIVGVFDIWRL